MLAGLHVLTIPASRPLPFALGGVLATARTEVLVLRVTSARVGIGSAAQEGRAAHAQGRKFTAWGSHHDGRDERGQYNNCDGLPAPELNSSQVTALIAFIIVGARFPELDATPLC